MMSLIQRIVEDDQGAETVEYALVGGLLAVAAIATISLFATNVAGVWAYIASRAAAAS